MLFRYRLEEAGPVGPGPGEDGGQSVHKLLQEKENDLVLAAELGKALLDKSEQISHAREAIVLDYTQKLEVCAGRRNMYCTTYFGTVTKIFVGNMHVTWCAGAVTRQVPADPPAGEAGGGVPAGSRRAPGIENICEAPE